MSVTEQRKTGKLIKVLIGEVILTRPPNQLQTVLGSCIGLVIYCPVTGISGMAHILLPDSRKQPNSKYPGKFADTAVPCLVDSLKELGASPAKLLAKFAGGAKMFGASLQYGSNDVGSMNITAVNEILGRYRIPVIACDVGGMNGRKIEFDPTSAQLYVEKLNAGRETI